MSQKTITLYGDTQGSIIGDTAAPSGGAVNVVLRDPSNNSVFNQVSAAELKSTGLLTLATPPTKTSAFTADATSSDYICDATSAAFTATLPSASSCSGRIYNFHKKDNVHNVTVQGAGAELIDGANTAVISTQYGTVRVISDGTQWWTR